MTTQLPHASPNVFLGTAVRPDNRLPHPLAKLPILTANHRLQARIAAGCCGTGFI